MVLAVKGIDKSFGPLKVLNAVDIDISAGEIHALAGENGAGKSTLVKILTGVVQPDSGGIFFDGKPVKWAAPLAAKRRGIRVIFQEFALFGEKTVAENIFISHEKYGLFSRVSSSEQTDRAAELIGKIGLSIDPRVKASELSVAEQQMVEICRALSSKTSVLILDEPTAVISGREVTLLFDILHKLKNEGVGILFISHRVNEIFENCDRVTVLKDGQLVSSLPTSQTSPDDLVAKMVGRPLGDLYPIKPKVDRSGTPALQAIRLNCGRMVRDVDLSVHPGEVVGIAGMVGSGRTEVVRAIFGADEISSGEIRVNGKPVGRMTSETAIANGIGFLTEDRKIEGLFLPLDIASNVTASSLSGVSRHGLIDAGRELCIAGREMKRFNVAAAGPSAPVRNLSGGNQQKVLLARWAGNSKTLLILDEPTRGIDVGAKAEIYRQIRVLASESTAVLVVSSELPEVIGLCDRVYVMRDGQMAGELTGADISERSIMSLAAHHA